MGGAITLTGAAGVPGAGAVSALHRRGRAALSHGVASGDVTARGATLWGRSTAPGRLVAEVLVPGRRRQVRRYRGPVVGAASDFTGAIRLDHLEPGETYEYRLLVENEDGAGPPTSGELRTAPEDRRDISFAWTGDTAGQGWGRHTERGMPGYAAMAAVDPDFWVHCGDTVYADGPIAPSVVLPDGQVWTNVVSDGVEAIAQSLEDFRGRHRYNLGDPHVQAMNAQVPVYVQWDDHEVTNNWYPGEILDGGLYDREPRVDVLAAYAKQALSEYYPLDARSRDPEGKVYGKFSRGPLLDVFMLDMRTYRGANTDNLQPAAGPQTPFLGAQQVDWLVAELSASTATWKAVMADMPLGLVVPDGSLFEAVANADPGPPLGRELEIAALLSRLKAAGVANVVWFTADVHYCAAHHYDPARASFTDFDPFWEFVGGPINSGSFGPSALDPTFGPQVVFNAFPDYPNQDPGAGNQFFGLARVDGRSGALEVSLRDTTGAVRHTQVITPV